MTKKRFMQLAEKVGICSSDWKHQLWETHTAALAANPSWEADDMTVRQALALSKVTAKIVCDAVRKQLHDGKYGGGKSRG